MGSAAKIVLGVVVLSALGGQLPAYAQARSRQAAAWSEDQKHRILKRHIDAVNSGSVVRSKACLDSAKMFGQYFFDSRSDRSDAKKEEKVFDLLNRWNGECIQ